MASLKFFKGTEAQVVAKNPELGSVWFDTTNRLIKVKIAESGDNMWQAYSGLQNAEWLSETKQLQLTKADGSKFVVDFSDVASATAVGAFADAASNTANSSVHARINQAFLNIDTKLAAEDQVVKSVDTTADAGVALVHDADGKLSVSVAEGAVAENNTAVVLGGQVYAAIDDAKKDLGQQISGKNVDAEGDTYVNATAENNKVTVTATQTLIDAVAATVGLKDAAYVTVESLNKTAEDYASDVKDALDLDIEAIHKMIGVPVEVEGKEAYSEAYTVAQDIKAAKNAAAAAQKTIDDFLTGEGVDPNKVDALKDIITYMEEHGEDYEAVVENLETLNDDVAILKGDANTVGSVAKAVADAKAEILKTVEDNETATGKALEEIEARLKDLEDIDAGEEIKNIKLRLGNAETAISTTLPKAISDAIDSANLYTDEAVEALDKKIDAGLSWGLFE